MRVNWFINKTAEQCGTMYSKEVFLPLDCVGVHDVVLRHSPGFIWLDISEKESTQFRVVLCHRVNPVNTQLLHFYRQNCADDEIILWANWSLMSTIAKISFLLAAKWVL